MKIEPTELLISPSYIYPNYYTAAQDKGTAQGSRAHLEHQL